MPDTTDRLLAERGKTYGDFTFHAEITQELKRVMGAAPGWQRLNAHQREALEMIQHKVGRILNGDPNYRDSWADIGGYARLAEERCNQQTPAAQLQALVRAQVKAQAAPGTPLFPMHDFNYTDKHDFNSNKIPAADEVNGVSHSEG